MTSNRYNNRNSGIDVLRGLAILSVILLHVNIRVPFNQTFIGDAMPDSIYKIVFWSGYYGVCMFFVISGFLITTSSLQKWNSLGNVSPRGFYAMRFARIMPLLLLLLLVLSILHLSGIRGFVINSERMSLGEAVFAALTFHINWLEITKGYLPGAWDVLWSLSIEETFYLFFPLVLLLLRKEWQFAILTLAFLVISPFARTIWFTHYGLAEADHNHFAYLDALALGCIAAVITKRVEFKKNQLLLLGIIGAFLMSSILFFRRWTPVHELSKIALNVTVLSIGTAFVLIWMQKRFTNGLQRPSRLTGWLRFMGRNSYEVYLTHMFVVFMMVKYFQEMNLAGEWVWTLYLTVIFVSGILGELVARYFSNPMNHLLRERFKQFSGLRPATIAKTISGKEKRQDSGRFRR